MVSGILPRSDHLLHKKGQAVNHLLNNFFCPGKNGRYAKKGVYFVKPSSKEWRTQLLNTDGVQLTLTSDEGELSILVKPSSKEWPNHTRLLNADGVHLTSDGYELWIKSILDVCEDKMIIPFRQNEVFDSAGNVIDQYDYLAQRKPIKVDGHKEFNDPYESYYNFSA